MQLAWKPEWISATDLAKKQQFEHAFQKKQTANLTIILNILQ